MTIATDTLKEEIYDKLAEINDENVLSAIKTIINKLENDSLDKFTVKEDFSGYIKEWVKSM
ncbi:hypothetical protein C7447_101981 [Tenacibaculum adriaticum]|uniref:Uncharacterized protein n=1 Tax=Tenacibaculum adriaticum TaxID=413713 RepID=A0A5S5DYQ2_9FLAO|nr:hypothetical protein [Tenacibaculum adriaticum]TYQ00369.1 hypothetical protein C7447_101981 [Tenacibaculum adriaticum]